MKPRERETTPAIEAVQKVTLKEDEYLVFKVSGEVSYNAIAQYREQLEQFFGRENAQRILVITDRVQMVQLKIPSVAEKYLLGKEDE